MCFWIVLKISCSDSLPAVGKRLIERKIWGILPSFGRVMIFTSSKVPGSDQAEGSD
jgi:hypothetical protein